MNKEIYPHYEKLIAAKNNPKLPSSDKERLEKAIYRYKKWVHDLDNIEENTSLEVIVYNMVQLLNDYKTYIDLELIFDSKNDFLYRQKGQLKIDNSIIEEFLIHLTKKTLRKESLEYDLRIGPVNHVNDIHFQTGFYGCKEGLNIQTKFQGFAISRTIYLTSSYNKFSKSQIRRELHIPYIIAEFKTNLDKTMFQEASATSNQVKTSVIGSKYFILCEWLDMIPIDTSLTDIDEVILLRKGKRIPIKLRKKFYTYEGRKQNREEFIKYLKDNPLRYEMFYRLVKHFKSAFIKEGRTNNEEILQYGFF